MTATPISPEFGAYLEHLRKSREKTLRNTADALKVSPQYYSQVEKGRSLPLTEKRIADIAVFLNLKEEEREELKRLSYVDRKYKRIPEDCATYAQSLPIVVEALRTAKELGAGEEEWQQMLEVLRKKKG